MNISVEDAREIAWDEHEDWEQVLEEITGQSRWSIDYMGICKHKPTNKTYRFYYSRGATESQDEEPYQYDDGEIDVIEVEQKEVSVMQWVDK